MSDVSTSDVSADSTTTYAPAHRWRRYRRLAVVALLGATVCYLLMVTMDWPASPDPIPQELRGAVASRSDLVGRTNVYDCFGNFIDSQQLWRVEVRPELVPAIVWEFGLTELKAARRWAGQRR